MRISDWSSDVCSSNMFKGAYMRSVPIGLPLVAAAFLAGCATTPGGQRLAERDPLESWNRNVWAFNRGVDNALLKPGAQTYKAVTPTAARRGVRNVLNHAHRSEKGREGKEGVT